MQKISKVWHLRGVDIECLASFVWKTALILFGLKFIFDIAASILYIYALTEPGMNAHKFTGFDASVGVLSTAATTILQLLAARFAIEVALRLTAEQKP